MSRLDRRRRIALIAAGLLAASGAAILAIGSRDEVPPGRAPVPRGESAATPALAPRPPPARPPPVAAQRTGIQFAPHDPALKGVGAVRLRVVRAGDDAPVAGAEVVLHGTGHGGEIVRVAARSGTDGRAELREVPAGPWLTLQANVPGERAVVRADVDVVRDQVLDLGEFRIGLRRTLRVSVSDDAARPVGAAHVSALPLTLWEAERLRSWRPDWHLAWRPANARRLLATTNAEGIAAIDGVPPGPCLVTADRGGDAPARALVEVPLETDPAVPPLVLRPAVHLRGRLVDAGGSPVLGGRVLAADRDRLLPSWPRALPRWTDAHAGGRFDLALPAVAPLGGLWAIADGFPLTWVPVDGPRDDLVVVLPAGARISLTAFDAGSGAPLAGASVETRVATGDGTWEWDAETASAGRLEATLAVGRLLEFQVSPGSHMRGRAPPPDRPETVIFPIDMPTDLRVGDPVRVVSRHPYWPSVGLDGVVIGPDGRGLAGVTVDDDPRNEWPPTPRAVTDASGAFRLEHEIWTDRKLTRTTHLNVFAPGWVERDMWPAVVSPNGGFENLQTTVEAIPSATVRGRVVDETGAAVVGARVRWEGQRHRSERPDLFTDSDGRFVMADLEPTDRFGLPSSARLLVEARGFTQARTEEFAVRIGTTVDVGDVVLSRGARVHGVVRDPSGAPAAGRRVSLLPRMWLSPSPPLDWVFYGLTRADGSYEVRGVPLRYSGTVTVQPRRAGELRTSVDVDLGEAESDRAVEVRLEVSVAVEGLVVDAAGRPAAGADVVFLRSEPPWSDRTRTDARGAFRFDAVPIAEATIGAFAGGIFPGEAGEGAEVRLVVPSREGVRLPLARVDDAALARMPTRAYAGWFRDDTPPPPDDSDW